MKKWDLLQAHKDCCNTNIRRLATSSKIRTLVPCAKRDQKFPSCPVSKKNLGPCDSFPKFSSEKTEAP